MIHDKRMHAGKLVYELTRHLHLFREEVATPSNVALVTNLQNTLNALKLTYRLAEAYDSTEPKKRRKKK
jgi:hypothetical protein